MHKQATELCQKTSPDSEQQDHLEYQQCVHDSDQPDHLSTTQQSQVSTNGIPNGFPYDEDVVYAFNSICHIQELMCSDASRLAVWDTYQEANSACIVAKQAKFSTNVHFHLQN